MSRDPDPNEMAFIAELIKELDRARKKFPRTRHLNAALVEETGEVSTALMDLDNAPCIKNVRGLRNECIQTAAMAMRIALEGDEDFPESVRGVGVDWSSDTVATRDEPWAGCLTSGP